MNNFDATYRFAFNELADVLQFGNILDSHCASREECERKFSAIAAIVERMKKLIEKMED